jgi:hypothetical protein
MDTQYRTTANDLSRGGLRSASMLIVVACLLIAGAAEQATAQIAGYGSGTHGVFPPDPEGGVPAGTGYAVWNIRTGVVRYCSVYTIGTGLDTCDSNSSVNLTAQIPNIPPGGLTSGIYEFSDFNFVPLVNNHRRLVIVGYSPNTPLSILSQNNIVFGDTLGYITELYINGANGRTVTGSQAGFSAAGGKGGPGGFDGGASGNGSSTPSNGSAGFGPAGGAGGQTGGSVAATFGGFGATGPLNPSLTPLSGGSGGGGAAGWAAGAAGCNGNVVGYGGGPGGGGGGALLLAAAGTITLASGGRINAYGGNGGYNQDSGCGLWGGGGAGGNVRIVAAQFTGTGTIYVGGGVRADGQARASGGFVRIETSSNTYAGAIDSAAGGSFISFPTAPVPGNQPVLQITSLGGTNAPANPSSALNSPDITFSQPVSQAVVAVAGTNVPDGTQVTIKVVPATGSPVTTSATLNGTFGATTGQATVTLPPGAGMITATATFNVSQITSLLPSSLPLLDGEKPQRVEVVAMADGTSRTYLLSRTGARFEIARGLR